MATLNHCFTKGKPRREVADKIALAIAESASSPPNVAAHNVFIIGYSK